MAQTNNNQSVETIKESTFSASVLPKATPIVLQKPLKLATGSIFKVLSGTNEDVKDSNGDNTVRACYRVQSLRTVQQKRALVGCAQKVNLSIKRHMQFSQI